MPVPSKSVPRAARAAGGVLLVGAALASTSPVRVAAAEPDPDGGCVDVAADVGLDFRGAYGTTMIPTPMGAMMQRNMGNGAAVGDYDADGDLDVFLLGQAGQPDALYRNDLVPGGDLRFTDVTAAAGVGDPWLSRVAHLADLDGDGWLDLLVVNDTLEDGSRGTSMLYRNRRDGTFEDVTQGSGFAPSGFIVGGASLADVEGDGDLDVFLTYWTEELGGDPALRDSRGTYPAQNLLYRNDGGFQFTDVSRESGLGGIRRDSFSSVFADFDGDVDLDLYVAVDHREDLYYEQVAPMRFVDRSATVGVVHKGNDMGVAVADLASDGALDVFVTNITDPTGEIGTGSGNVLWRAEGTGDSLRFVNRAAELGVDDTAWGWGTAWLDIDLDGDLDLYAVQGMDEYVTMTSLPLRDATARLFLADGDALTLAQGTGCDIPGDQRSLVAFDADRDGDLDLLVTQVAFHARLLENRMARGGSITVDLAAGGAAAPGARVSVTAGDRTTTQVVLAGGSYLAGPPMEVVAGVGDALVADVLVRWADGRETLLEGVPAGARVAPVP